MVRYYCGVKGCFRADLRWSPCIFSERTPGYIRRARDPECRVDPQVCADTIVDTQPHIPIQELVS